MDEVAFLGKTYESLYTEMETLAQDNRQMARMRRREMLTDLLLGRCTEDVRLPLVGLTDATKARIKAAMEHAGIL